MYHCSTMPMSLHIANGMFGAVIIDPPGLPASTASTCSCSPSCTSGPQGDVADPAKVAGEHPDLVVFNGYATSTATARWRPAPGERVRFWVLDAGPNLPSAFHVVGGQFDTVYREGDWVLRDGGSTGTGGAQVLDLAPAQGGFVELTFPEAGTYPFVSPRDGRRRVRGPGPGLVAGELTRGGCQGPSMWSHLVVSALTVFPVKSFAGRDDVDGAEIAGPRATGGGWSSTRTARR